MKKRICLLLLVLIFCVMILRILFNPYARITRYVNDNEGNLRTSCEFYLEQKHMNKADTEIDVMETLLPDCNKVQPNMFRKNRVNRRIQFPEYLIYKRI